METKENASSMMMGHIRTFNPVILFHDHEFATENTIKHIHIPYRDPHYEPYIQKRKQCIDQMLEDNGKFWSSFTEYRIRDDDAAECSPMPSLTSSPTPPLVPYDLPSPPDSSSSPSPTQDKYGSRQNVFLAKPYHQSKRKRGNLPKTTTAILRAWLLKHKTHPYPTEDQKQELAHATNLTVHQISNWFINARRRILQPMLDKEHYSELDIYPYEAGTSENRLAK
ncbi:hypothetical protein NQZ79_g7650 [Umbelopsis isabellina]|nr:hypothetical protein NQZ79_g7650 [Umbelopsis isabellina]